MDLTGTWDGRELTLVRGLRLQTTANGNGGPGESPRSVRMVIRGTAEGVVGHGRGRRDRPHVPLALSIRPSDRLAGSWLGGLRRPDGPVGRRHADSTARGSGSSDCCWARRRWSSARPGPPAAAGLRRRNGGDPAPPSRPSVRRRTLLGRLLQIGDQVDPSLLVRESLRKGHPVAGNVVRAGFARYALIVFRVPDDAGVLHRIGIVEAFDRPPTCGRRHRAATARTRFWPSCRVWAPIALPEHGPRPAAGSCVQAGAWGCDGQGQGQGRSQAEGPLLDQGSLPSSVTGGDGSPFECA